MPAYARRNPVLPRPHRDPRTRPLAPPPPSAPSRMTRTTCMRMCSGRSRTSRHRRHVPRTRLSACRAAAQTPMHAQAAFRSNCGRSRFGGSHACMTPSRRTAAVTWTTARCAGQHTMGPTHRAGRHTHACVLETMPQTPAPTLLHMGGPCSRVSWKSQHAPRQMAVLETPCAHRTACPARGQQHAVRREGGGMHGVFRRRS